MHNKKKYFGSLLTKKWFKDNIISFFIGSIISLVITVSATVVLNSNQVRYKNDKSVETAINELYQKVEDIEMKKLGCYGCTKLEYLESTGTQWIETNTKYYDIGQIDMTFLVTKNHHTVFGQNIGGGEVLLFYQGGARSYINGTYVTHASLKLNEIYHVIFDITNGNASLTINNELIGTSTGSSNNSNIYLMRIFSGDSNSFEYERFYLFKCTDNDGNLLFDFIPVLDKNNRPCMFDKVSKTCFYNQGTGEFLYG